MTPAAVLCCVLSIGTSIGLGACGGQPAADTETSMSASTTAVHSTAAASDEATGDDVGVLHPYHNEFLDAPTYLLPESITLAHSLPDFPESVPAQRISSEMLPDTDLTLEPNSSVAGRYSWLSSVDDISQTDVTLGSQDVAAEVAHAFLDAHGLWDEGYSAPQVSVGSSEGGADVKITSWVVRFDREPVAAGLERYVRVRVGDNDEVIQVSLAIPQLEPLEDKLVRLRPVAEVVADLKAWQMGDSGALQNEIQGEVAVEIRSVLLAYEDPGSGDEPIAVPVYRFEVEVRGLEGAAPMAGFWTVVAAADVVRDPQESGRVVGQRPPRTRRPPPSPPSLAPMGPSCRSRPGKSSLRWSRFPPIPRRVRPAVFPLIWRTVTVVRSWPGSSTRSRCRQSRQWNRWLGSRSMSLSGMAVSST